MRTLTSSSNGESVATLALGSRPKQGVARLRAKRETRESRHMLPGVQRVWGHEPSHSQVNSHVGKWSPEWTPKVLERNYKVKTAQFEAFFVSSKSSWSVNA
jgi:hypothetical protein